MSRATRNLILLHLPANALLLWLAYQWLGVDESSGLKLVWSAVFALVVLGLFCWLFGATMIYRWIPDEPRIPVAFRATLRRVPLLMLLAVAVLAVYWLIGHWSDAADAPPFNVASWLTLKLRRPVKPATVQSIYHTGFWLLRWVVLPVLLLPLAEGLAHKGRYGWRNALRRRPRQMWVRVPLLLVAGLWLPLVLLGWTPSVGAFWLEMLSFVLRAAAAYALFVGSLVTLASGEIPLIKR